MCLVDKKENDKREKGLEVSGSLGQFRYTLPTLAKSRGLDRCSMLCISRESRDASTVRADRVVTAYQFLTRRIFIDGVMLPVRAAKEADFNRILPLVLMPRDAGRIRAT